MATATGKAQSNTATQSFSPSIPSGTLVWSEEFSNSTGAKAEPNPQLWTYDTGNSGFGNQELETYCAWDSSVSPCDNSHPNAYVDTSGILHIVAQSPGTGVYTSARMKTQGLFSFQYGRLEVRAQMPEEQGLWPSAWMLGNNYLTAGWPASGEMDIMERVNAATSPDWNEGSIHGPGFTGSAIGTKYYYPTGQSAAGWHTYGMIWKPGSIAYYVDDSTHPYATFTTSSIAAYNGSSWPFDFGPGFIILNLAVGGNYPGAPDATTQFPAEIQVDYVRIYTS
jgi:beta-glucanase (GH16 family)